MELSGKLRERNDLEISFLIIDEVDVACKLLAKFSFP